MHILLLEPYYGGSHKHWADGIKQHSQHKVDIIQLEDKYWKWRMHGASIEFVKNIQTYDIPDLFLCSSLMDVSIFKALLPPQYREIPIALYMHENQLMYPISQKDTDVSQGRDFHYGFINYVSCLSANIILFNTHYHKSEFYKALKIYLNKLPDYQNIDSIESLIEKSVTIPVGIHKTGDSTVKPSSLIPKILWNHRWEYDKNPSLFYQQLITLEKTGFEFELILLGSKPDNKLEVYDRIISSFSSKIIHAGYCTKAEYLQWLKEADYVVSTSIHEFQGLSVLEAVLYGACPILPYRLSYPDIFSTSSDRIFYKKDELLHQTIIHLQKKPLLDQEKDELKNVAKTYLWESVIVQYDELFETLIN